MWIGLSNFDWLAGGAPWALLLQASSPLQNPLVPIIMMVVIFYLVLFLPMRRKQRKLDSMLQNLKNGDKVVTNGGVIGTLVALLDHTTLIDPLRDQRDDRMRRLGIELRAVGVG